MSSLSWRRSGIFRFSIAFLMRKSPWRWAQAPGEAVSTTMRCSTEARRMAASSAGETDVPQLCKGLAVTFEDLSPLQLALTHASNDNETNTTGSMSYERLEFVGDRVLGLAVAELLYRRFPGESEGGLALRCKQLVRSETLASIARNLELGDYICMGTMEENLGARNKDSILSDTLEAVVAAIYFDQGLSAAQEFVERNWDPYFNESFLTTEEFSTTLQKVVHAKGFTSPVYQISFTEGPGHATKFTMAVLVEGIGEAEGVGTTKRTARQAAAESFLEKYKDVI